MTTPSPHRSRPPWRAFFAPLVVLLLAGCGVAIEDQTPTPGPPTAAPAPTATPDSELERNGGIAIVQRAYDRLLDQYIEPVDPSRLLDGAWTVLSQEAEAQELDAPAKPAFADDREADFALFRQAYIALAQDANDASALRHASIRGMTEALQDCHTFFLSPVASDNLEGAREGRGTVGIGVELVGIPPLVTEVVATSPAERVGVLVGDRIVAIDGEDTTGEGPAGAYERLNGDEGTTVVVAVERDDGATAAAYEILRERVNPPNIEARLVEGVVGYVRVRNFVDDGIAADLRRTIDDFEIQGATAWVLDIRGNPGGRLDVGAISLFVPSGVIVRDQDRAGEIHEEMASGLALQTIRPMVLLTNNRTGSVAEVFAAALKEYGIAYVIGENTNGCAGYTTIEELGDGSSLAVTTHVNLGPVTSEVLAGPGVAPDETVLRTEEDIVALEDPQLDAAVEHLRAVGAIP
jgi:carboxyl-terminal processing protease